MPLIAQQEDHIVRRGHYKPAVTDTLKSEPIVKAPSRWYNIITANFAFEEYYPLGVGYMRLKQTGSFYFGPGMHARLAWDVAMSAGVDAFIHGRLEAPSGFRGSKERIHISVFLQEVNSLVILPYTLTIAPDSLSITESTPLSG